jgi:uncharacterized membrane protein
MRFDGKKIIFSNVASVIGNGFSILSMIFLYYLAGVWSELKFRVPKVVKNISTLGTLST